MQGRVELLFVAGQIGWDSEARLVSGDFVEQFARRAGQRPGVVRAAGGRPASAGAHRRLRHRQARVPRRRREVGAAWRERMGRHYPAMALVEVKSLLLDEAKVEIEATAVL